MIRPPDDELMVLPTSLRLMLNHLMGRNTSMRVTCQWMAGFQKMASNMARAADGVMTS